MARRDDKRWPGKGGRGDYKEEERGRTAGTEDGGRGDGTAREDKQWRTADEVAKEDRRRG